MCYFISGLNYADLELMERKERTRWWNMLLKQKEAEKPKKS